MADAPSPDSLDYQYEQLNQVVHLVTTGLALALTGLLAFGFLANITRFRYWRNSKVLIFLLTLAKSPLVHWIGQFQAFVVDINLSYPKELYLVWAVLLTTGFSSFYSIVGYSIFTSNKKKLMIHNEKIQLLNSLGMLGLLVYDTLLYTKFGKKIIDNATYGAASAPSNSELGKGHFVTVLWLIWGFSLMKILYQITSYYYADRSFGSADTAWVSYYMKKIKDVENFDPKNMAGYRYLLVEEKPPKVGPGPNYEIIMQNPQDLVTIENVWQLKGSLLNSGRMATKLKDACLSFAWFKMLKRRFVEECDDTEANSPKDRDLVRWVILNRSPKHVFRIIDMELRFLRDLFYTKYATVLGWGLPLYVLHFGILFTSFFGIFFELDGYTPPNQDSYHIREVMVTKCILFTVMVIEVWEFIHYFFSNWTKVLLVCKYATYRNFHNNYTLINAVLWVFGSIYIPGQSTYQIGQYSLLKRCKKMRCSRRCREKFLCFGYTEKSRTVKYVRLHKEKIMKAILPSLNQLLDTGFQHPGIITVLSRHEIRAELFPWACELQNSVVQTVMIWHVATNFFWMTKKKAKLQRKCITKVKPVAVTLSNYCAYLVVNAPELLSINTYTTTLISEEIVLASHEFFEEASFLKRIPRDKMLEKMEKVKDDDDTVVGRGTRLAKMLKSETKEDEQLLWDFMKEIWADIILRLAPSKTCIEHATKLAEGGEFMTYLWVLLYHAGFPDQSSLKGDSTSLV